MIRFLAVIVVALFLTNCENDKPVSKRVENVLKGIAEDINKSCPMRVDSLIRLENTLADGTTFRYNYTLKFDTVKNDLKRFEKDLRITTLNTLKTSPDAKYFRGLRATMVYHFSDTLGNYLFEMVMNPKEYIK
jgi:hypothetical protein